MKGSSFTLVKSLMGILFLSLFLATPLVSDPVRSDKVISIGSKSFTENYILAEIMARLLEDNGFTVERKVGLGGTLITYSALRENEIQIYPEYTGTLEKVILKFEADGNIHKIRRRLNQSGPFRLLSPFGFNNTYALGMLKKKADERNIKLISDLKNINHLRYGFNHEFTDRPDGWKLLSDSYGLNVQATMMNHSLLYKALETNSIDVMNIYTTDGEIPRYDIQVIEDDKNVFPVYLGAPLIRKELDPRAIKLLNLLGGRIDQERMLQLNYTAETGTSIGEVADQFLREEGLITGEQQSNRTGFFFTLMRRTGEHIWITTIAVMSAVFLAVPFAISIHHKPQWGRPFLFTAGLIQTIPSIALLAFMIPLFGIGVKPAIAALFLYALLPILRNTHAALGSMDAVVKKVSIAMGLTTWQRLMYVELPLAFPGIFAGVRTAAIINIGTATLAAFIGAGGLGEPIVTGLAMNDTSLILEGAIPAAVLAIIVETIFELVEKRWIPPHMRGKE